MPTHSELVLNLLSDGEPHTHIEGYRLGVMLHSRVADLRKKGYAIECWREGDLYLYRLVGEAATDPGGLSSERASESALTGPAAMTRDPGRACSPHEQLSLEAA